MKKCTSCLEEKQLSEFAKKKSNPDGLQYHCRGCVAKYAASWREKNAEKIRQTGKAYAKANAERARIRAKEWALANPERKREADNRYRLENSEALRKAQAKWRAENKETIRAKKKEYAARNKQKLKEVRVRAYLAKVEENRAAAKEWAKANPEKRRAQNALRKATKIKATPKWADLEAIAEFYAYAVHLSKSTGILHHVDHVIPLRSSKVCGLHCETNLQVIPAEENLKKRNNFESF